MRKVNGEFFLRKVNGEFYQHYSIKLKFTLKEIHCEAN